jgi:hypothetical protein
MQNFFIHTSPWPSARWTQSERRLPEDQYLSWEIT